MPLAQARRSLTRARALLELMAGELVGPGALMSAEDHELALLLGAEPRLAGEFARRRLAPLDAVGGAATRANLALTLRAWLRAPGQRKAIAEELDVHPQTVRYRMTRLRELFGRSWTIPTGASSWSWRCAWSPSWPRLFAQKVPVQYLQRRDAEKLEGAVESGTVDTVLLAMTDMQGRLQGKRLAATHFLAEVAEHGAEGCNYLLAVDVDMATVEGYACPPGSAATATCAVPDLDTLRPVPWQEGTVICLADVAWLDGREVLASPRQILRRQLARLAERGWSANAGTELEFMVFLDTYEEAWHKRYRGLRPANLYNVDYSLLGTARVEPLIRRIRNAMAGGGHGRGGLQGRVQLRPARDQLPLRRRPAHLPTSTSSSRTAPRRSPPRRAWRSRFMAKYDEREGNSCHIHFSLADADGPAVPRARAACSTPSSPGSWPACAR